VKLISSPPDKLAAKKMTAVPGIVPLKDPDE
jgi:hypothetical protein